MKKTIDYVFARNQKGILVRQLLRELGNWIEYHRMFETSEVVAGLDELGPGDELRIRILAAVDKTRTCQARRA